MVETKKTEPPSYDAAVECLEELENMLTTTAIKIEETPVGKNFQTKRRSRPHFLVRPYFLVRGQRSFS